MLKDAFHDAYRTPQPTMVRAVLISEIVSVLVRSSNGLSAASSSVFRMMIIRMKF